MLPMEVTVFIEKCEWSSVGSIAGNFLYRRKDFLTMNNLTFTPETPE